LLLKWNRLKRVKKFAYWISTYSKETEYRKMFSKILFVCLISFVFAQDEVDTQINLNFAGMIKERDVEERGNSNDNPCSKLPSQSKLKSALKAAIVPDNGGFDFNMWATLVNRDGIVCSVAFTGNDRGDQWPGSRVISAQKANTANAFCLPQFSLSSANLYTATQPGGTLFGLQESNPVDTSAAYAGPSDRYGQSNDPLGGKKVGGVNVFGGGLGLYDEHGVLIGGLGVSGDSSCADHNVAWRVRNTLKLDYVPAGVSDDTQRKDNIVYTIGSGWAHPVCSDSAKTISEGLPINRVVA